MLTNSPSLHTTIQLGENYGISNDQSILPIDGPTVVAVNQVIETDSVQSITHNKTKSLGQTSVTSTAQSVLALSPTTTFPKTSLVDDFSYTENPISNGGKWAAGHGFTAGETNGTDWVAAGFNAAYRTDIIAKDVEAWGTLGTVVANGLSIRVSDPSLSTYDCYLLSASASAILLSRVDNGVATTLGQAPLAGLSTGDEVGIRAVGSTIEVFVKISSVWYKVIGAVDSTYSSPGYIDMSGVVSSWQNFKGGAIPTAIGQASEADSVQSIGRSKAITLGQATETDSVQSIAAHKVKEIGIVSETDAARPVKPGSGPFYSLAVAKGASHYYAGNEASGTTISDDIGGEDATLTGDTPTYQEERTAATEPAVLDWPSDDGMDIPAAADPVNGSTPFSVCAWVKLTSSGNYQNIYQRRGPTNDHGFILYAHPTWTELIAVIGDGSSSMPAFTGAHTYGTTYMVTAVYDGTNITIYLNETQKDSWPLGFTPVAGSDTPSVSSITGNSLPLAIFKGVALSGSDVADLYSAGKISLSATVAQASEADSATAITGNKTKAIGQATETDSVQSVGHFKTRSVGQISETDTAQAITVSRLLAVGQNSETDAAQSVLVKKSVSLGQATETDSAQAISSLKVASLGITSETDTAQAIIKIDPFLVQVGQTNESDSAQSVTRQKTLAIGQASETDEAQAIGKIDPILVVLGQASETDSVQAIAGSKAAATNQTSETDSALSISSAKRLAVGQTSETDTSQPFTNRRTIGIGQAESTSSAQPITAVKSVTLGQTNETDQSIHLVVPYQITGVGETDEALAVAAKRTYAVGQATESDSASAFTYARGATLGQAFETDSVTSIQPKRTFTIGQSSEIDSAQSVTSKKNMPISQIAEIDTAQSFVARKSRTLSTPEEANEVFSVGHLKSLAVSHISESDSSQALRPIRSYLIDYASEIDSATSVHGFRSHTLGIASETDSAIHIRRPSTYNLYGRFYIHSSYKNLKAEGDDEIRLDLGDVQVVIEGDDPSIIQVENKQVLSVIDEPKWVRNRVPATQNISYVDSYVTAEPLSEDEVSLTINSPSYTFRLVDDEEELVVA